MRRVWYTQAGKRLQDMYHNIRERVITDYQQWLMEDHLWELRMNYDTNKFKTKAQKAKANQAATKGGSLHIGGSTTTENTSVDGK